MISGENTIIQNIDVQLVTDLREIINGARSRVATMVNSELTLMYWHIGERINREILGNHRADYGKQIVSQVATKLQEEFGEQNFSVKNIRRMMQFATEYPDYQNVVSLLRQLSWTHFIALIPIEDSLKRKFYEQMAINERWSVRTLRGRIDSMLYERTAISKQPEETIQNDLALLENEQKMTPELSFRDPYVLDFLGLHDTFSERDLESAILRELQDFIVEMGSDFAFLARQKRITIDNEDYYIDLLFFHRRLRCLVAIELKLGEFKASYKGQMELYLNWLKQYDTAEGENNPIGLILCAGKNEEHVELLHLHENNIRVAEYLTKLPDKHIFEQKLLLAIERAKSSTI